MVRHFFWIDFLVLCWFFLRFLKLLGGFWKFSCGSWRFSGGSRRSSDNLFLLCYGLTIASFMIGVCAFNLQSCFLWKLIWNGLYQIFNTFSMIEFNIRRTLVIFWHCKVILIFEISTHFAPVIWKWVEKSCENANNSLSKIDFCLSEFSYYYESQYSQQ